MAGVYTDNQPDFSYLAPGETKAFSQYWYPITQIGPAHQATTEAAVSLTLEHGRARVGVAVTRPRSVAVSLRRVSASAVLHEGTAEVDPGHPALIDVNADSADLDDLEVVVTALELEGDELIRWRHRPSDAIGDEPATATEPPLPDEIESLDELYLTGVHLAQYRHPTRDCEPYWEEALRRDPGDSRSAIALAARRHHAGRYDDALALLTRARERLTFRNPNPRDGEVFYRLGLVLTRLGDQSAAYDAFAKAAWDARWVGPASLRMATLDAYAGRTEHALDTVLVARRHDVDDLRARCLEVVLLRRLGRADEALALLEHTRRLDPLDQWARALAGEQLTRDARTLLDVALDYAHCGELDDALALLNRAAHEPPAERPGGAEDVVELGLLLLQPGEDPLEAVEGGLEHAHAERADVAQLRHCAALVDRREGEQGHCPRHLHHCAHAHPADGRLLLLAALQKVHQGRGHDGDGRPLHPVQQQEHAHEGLGEGRVLVAEAALKAPPLSQPRH